MDDPAASVEKLLRQQAAIAGFGSFALRKSDLLNILNEAARVCAEGLSAPFCKICRYREAENDLLVEAGYGWQEGVVGHVVSRADETSPQGRAFVTAAPSICNALREDSQFELPPFYARHGIVSSIDVIIKGSSHQPYGVLEIDSDEQRDYDQHDIDFLTSFANILAEAVATAARTSALTDSIEQMSALMREKDQLSDELTKARALADEANRAKSEFLSNMSHELRTPLNGILGFSEFMRDGVGGKRDPGKVVEYAGDIHTAGTHLLRLINDLLDLSKVEAGFLALAEEEIEVKQLLESSLSLVEAGARQSGVRAILAVDPSVGTIFVDPFRLRQVLINLLSNAIKFTPPGGSVTLGLMQRGDGVAITVADTGVGLTEAEIALALKPFGQVDVMHAANHEGTGLGLPIAKHLVELHGGDLTIKSVKGKGTTVLVNLPSAHTHPGV